MSLLYDFLHTYTGAKMSGFGLRALKKVIDEEGTLKKSSFVKYIVYGENTFGILTFLKLHKKYPGEVKLITRNPFFKEDLLNEWNCTLSSIRSEEVANAFMTLNPRFEVFKTSEEVLFYKDTKFHKFGGRAKPHELKEGELFFTESSYHVQLQAMFEEGEFENLDEILKEHQLHKIVSDIEISEPTDLVEKINFKIQTGEFESFGCEKLFFCESPKKFLNFVSNKKELNDDVYSFAAGISNDQAISVHFKCDREISKDPGTIILPQSMTHEWGSFILDFERFDEGTNTQEFKALTFIGEDDLQEEDLAKKIKLMKRVIERVLPELGKAQVDQSIRFNDEYRISGTNDTQFTNLQNQNVRFLGHGAAINHELSEKFQYFSRGIYAILNESL
jgi:hypothetical protein